MAPSATPTTPEPTILAFNPVSNTPSTQPSRRPSTQRPSSAPLPTPHPTSEVTHAPSAVAFVVQQTLKPSQLPTRTGDTSFPTSEPVVSGGSFLGAGTSGDQQGSSSKSAVVIIVAVVVAVFVLLACFVCVCVLPRRRKRRKPAGSIESTRAAVRDMLASPTNRSVTSFRVVEIAQECALTGRALPKVYRSALYLAKFENELTHTNNEFIY